MIDIYSNSWGPGDIGWQVQGPGVLAGKAIEHGIQKVSIGLFQRLVTLSTFSKHENNLSPHVREPNAVLDSGFQAVDSGFRVLVSSLCQLNLDSGMQSLERLSGFLELYSEIQIPGFRIPQASKHEAKFNKLATISHGLYSYRPKSSEKNEGVVKNRVY